MKGKIYLCGPIAGMDWEEATRWRIDATIGLSEWDCSDPMQWTTQIPEGTAFQNGSKTSPSRAHRMFSRDWQSVKDSDIVLANIEWADGKGLPLVGTVSEIAWAWALKKPVLMVASKKWYEAQPFFTKQQVTAVEYTLTDAINALNRHSYTHQLHIDNQRYHTNANVHIQVS